MENVLTNRMFINVMLDPADVTKILRVWKWYCDKKLEPGSPIWVKEDLYEVWLDEPFDNRAWAMACTPYAKGTIPKDFARSIRWAYKICSHDDDYETPKKKKYKGRPANDSDPFFSDEMYEQAYKNARETGEVKGHA